MATLEAARLRLSALNAEVFRRILEIYDETVDGRALFAVSKWPMNHVANIVIARLGTGGLEELRYGSGISGDSKLVLQAHRPDPDQEFMVEVRFSPNVDLAQMAEAGLLGEAFNTMMAEYLQELREQGVKVDL